MAESIFWAVYLFSLACALIFAFGMVEDLMRQWCRGRRFERRN